MGKLARFTQRIREVLRNAKDEQEAIDQFVKDTVFDVWLQDAQARIEGREMWAELEGKK